MDAIYARQSVEKADSLSVQGQIDLCKKQAGEDFGVYQDRGFSGKNTNRPAFQRMMEDVEKGAIRKIIVYRLDRFSRSIADFGRLWEVLKKHGVEFVSINETFDTSTPMGRAMLNIIMVFAQLERETTAERVRDNYDQRVKLGAWPGGPAPFGFSVGRLPNGDGRPMPALIANDDAVAHCEQSDRISANGKIDIPGAQPRVKQCVDHFRDTLIERLRCQSLYIRLCKGRFTKGYIQAAVGSTLFTQGAVRSIGIAAVSGGYIQHVSITPRALFQKMFSIVCSSSPR